MPTRSRPYKSASMPSTPSVSLGPSMSPMSSPFGNQQQPVSVNVNGGNYLQPTQPQISTMSISAGSQPSVNAWELPLRFIPPTCLVDALLIGVLDHQRNLARIGTNREHLIGPQQPSLTAVLNSDRYRSNEVHPVSSVISNLLQRTALRSLPEKVAALFIIYRLFQWQILPSLETFNNIPEWYKPRSPQSVTHPIWATQIIWPRLRELVI